MSTAQPGPVGLSELDWLLARAAVCDPEAAAAAWRTWRGTATVDSAPDHAHPFLVAIGARTDAGLPDEEAGRLRGLTRRNWYVGQRLAALTGRCAGTLSTHGIRAIAFGPLVRSDGGQRQVSGVDLLVPSTDLAKAIELLRSDGVRVVRHATKRPTSVALLADHEANTVRLHRRLPYVGAARRPADGPRARCLTHHLVGHDLDALSSADALVLAAAPRLGWVDETDAAWPLDVHQLVGTNRESRWWDMVHHAASETPWGPAIADALAECRRRLHTEIPDDVLAHLTELPGPGAVTRLERSVRACRSAVRRRSSPPTAPPPVAV